MHHRSRRMRIAQSRKAKRRAAPSGLPLINEREPRYTVAGVMYQQDQDAGFPGVGWPVNREA